MRLFDTKVTIEYDLPSVRNDLGEETHRLAERDSEVSARLQPRSGSLSYEFPQRIRQMREQGLDSETTHILYLGAGNTIEAHDTITDADGDTYIVATVITQKTHKAAMLRKVK